MLLMILLTVCSGLITGYLGWISLKHTKLFAGLFVAAVPVLFGAVKLFAPFAGLASAGGLGNGNVWNMLGTMFDMLPDVVQNPILIIPITFFTGRILAWVYDKYFYTPVEETSLDRKERILKEYGLL